MCLIVFAWKVVPAVPLIAAANRDEFYERATAPAGAWPEHPHVYGGRDLKAGGSWMGIADSGQPGQSPRFAAITNIRCPSEHRDDAPSRVQRFFGSVMERGLMKCADPERTAYQFIHALRGDLYMQVMLNPTRAPTAGEIERHVDFVVRAFLDGYRV